MTGTPPASTPSTPNAPTQAIEKASPEQAARRWNDYGIGLLEQSQYEAAATAFRTAVALNPKDPDPIISAAIAEMKSERFGSEREQLSKARVLIDEALRINPNLARARFYHALILRSEGKSPAAAAVLAKIAEEYPRDREVHRQLGQTVYGLGRIGDARQAFEAVRAIDPNDTGAYQFLAPIYFSEGRQADGERARALYLLWRDDPLADAVGTQFFLSQPQWADERVSHHAHGDDAPARPTLTGMLAAPAH